jgi:UDP-GlcNAc:undecaprenyl-phosphate GlcNAc-1-phosphate transferase
VSGGSLARRPRVRNLAAFGVGLGLVRVAYRALAARPPGGGARWGRVNHRGEPVTLLEGPAVAAGLAASALVAPGLPARLRAAAALAALGGGGFGVLDDLAETGSSKGLRGHLGALRRGEVTTGGLKILGLGVTGLAAAALAGGGIPGGGAPGGAPRGRVRAAADLAGSGALIAGAANLFNLFDLRPGRALKVGLLHAPAALGAGPAAPVVAVATGAAAGMLPEDLGERAMLGDAGANALGAVLGLAVVVGARPRTRWGVLAGIAALTLASEKVSFTKVIAATPGLREFDALGRRPAAR